MENMKRAILIVLVAVIISGFIILYPNRFGESPSVQSNQQTNSEQNWESKINEQSAVTITVTPTAISRQTKEWTFDVVMNTHTVELDQDMLRVAVLVDNQGKEYKPIAWDGSAGGHHREGTLTFRQITPFPETIELKITGIGGDITRSFVWSL